MKSSNEQTLKHFRRSPIKQMARTILVAGPVNRVAVRAFEALPDWHWKHRVPVIGKEGVLLLDNGGKVRMTHTEKCQVAQQLFWGHGQLPDRADQQALLAVVSFCRASTTFLDIGAYTGLFALAAIRANPGLQSFAYEILPENFQILIENIMLNDAVLRVTPRLCGVGARSDTLRVPMATNLGVLPSSISLDWTFEQGIEIPVRNLDDLHRNDNGPMAIKIDVEGLEHDVLDGGKDLLKRAKPDILCEVLERAPKIGEIEAMMTSIGASIYQVTAEGLVHRDRIVPDKRMRDWVFTWRPPHELKGLGIELANSV